MEEITNNINKSHVMCVCNTRNFHDDCIVLIRYVSITDTMKVKQTKSKELGDSYEGNLHKIKRSKRLLWFACTKYQ